MLYDLKIFQKTYDFLLWLKTATQRFAKVHKYSLGIQLENEAIELLKDIVKANFKRGTKKQEIENCFVRYEIIKVLVRVGKDFGGSGCFNSNQYEFAAKQLDEIGALLGGWYKPYK